MKKFGVCINGKRKKRSDRAKPKEAESSEKINTKKRGDYGLFLCAKRHQKNLYFPEEVVEIMKHMNPQQLANILLSNDDWHVKTSTGNASGN